MRVSNACNNHIRVLKARLCICLVTYNHPETIYYKAARKLWHFAKDKIFNKIALIEHKRNFTGIGSYELGFSVDEPGIPMEVDYEPAPMVDSSQQTAFTDLTNQLPPMTEIGVLDDELLEDGMTAEEILEQARQAAQCAADKLTLQRPNGAHLSFLRQRSDGSTSLAVIGAHANAIEPEVKLEDICTRLTEGTAYLCGFKELEANRVKAIETLETPPFGSYLPVYDSTRSNLSKDDTALLSETYGEDDLGVQFASSIMQFAKDSDDVVYMVDSLLDALTHGQHTKAAAKIKEDAAVAAEQEQNKPADSEDDDAETAAVDAGEEKSEIQTELDDASSLVFELAQVQTQRLSSTTKPIQPAEEEVTLATKLSQKVRNFIALCSLSRFLPYDFSFSQLAEMISVYAAPVDITDIKSIRKAMGIQMKD